VAAISILLLMLQNLPIIIVCSLEADALKNLNKCRWQKSIEELSLCNQAIKIFSGSEVLLSQTLANQAVAYMNQGKIMEARKAAEENVLLVSRSHVFNRMSLIGPINLLAQTYRVNAEYVRAEQLYDRAIEIANQNKQTSLDLALVLHQKAVLDLYFGKEQEARGLTDQISDVYKKLPGNDLRQSEILVLYSDQAEARGEYHSAIQLAMKAFQIRTQPQFAEPEKCMESLGQLIRLYHLLQRYALSKDCAMKLLRLVNAAQECPETVHVNELLALGEEDVIERKLDEAEVHAQRAIKICTRLYGPNHPYKGTCLVLLGKISRLKGKLTESIVLINQALSTYEKSLGEKNRLIALALAERASTLRSQRSLVLSRIDYERSISMAKTILPAKHPLMAFLYKDYATLLAMQGERSRALLFNDQAKLILLDEKMTDKD
jgi:tetratricopeptide (TPR) repeat protein